MTLYAKAVLFLLAGALGWAVTGGPLAPHWPGAWLRFGWNAGVTLPGLLLGAMEAATLDGRRRRWAAILLGAGGSLVGVLVAQPALLRIGEFGVPALGGLLLGVFLSLPRRSLLLTTQYALGGLIGGLCGKGLLLLMVRLLETVPVLDALKRGIEFGVTAFGIGLVPALFKQTWLTADTAGKRETLLVKKTVTLGSDPNADIRVPKSPEVAPTHAVIETLPGMGRRRLRHAAGGTGTHAFPATRVNGRPVSGEQWLSDGDVIHIGARSWTFHDRKTRGEMRLGPVADGAWGKAGKAKDGPPGPPSLGGGSSTVQGAFHLSPQDIGRVGTRLLCTDGPYAGRVYPLGTAETTIGRLASCAVALPSDAGLAPVHATFTAEPGGHVLSGERVTVNGKLISAPVSLRLGDRIGLGATVLRYQ